MLAAIGAADTVDALGLVKPLVRQLPEEDRTTAIEAGQRRRQELDPRLPVDEIRANIAAATTLTELGQAAAGRESRLDDSERGVVLELYRRRRHQIIQEMDPDEAEASEQQAEGEAEAPGVMI